MPLRFDASDHGLARFLVPAIFVVSGVGVAVWFQFVAPPFSGWRRYAPLGVAAVLSLAGIRGIVREYRADAAREAARRSLDEHRDAPWRVRPEWRHPEIGTSDAVSRSFLALAAMWNLISWPLAFVVVGDGLGPMDPEFWMVAVFPVIGIGMLVRVAFEVARARKFGDTVVTVDPMPPRLGREFRGTLRVGRPLDARPEDGFLVRVSCYRQRVRHTRDSDGDRRREIERDLLWRDEARLLADGAWGGQDVEVPFAFDLPDDAPPSTPLKLDNRVLWEVAAQAELPGIDFGARVEIPVFAPEQGAGPLDGVSGPSGSDPEVVPRPVRSFEEPLTAGIRMIDEPGAFELHFTAARNRRSAVVFGLSSVVLLVGGIPMMGASILFGLIMLGMGGLFVYGAVQQGTNDTVLRIEGGRVEVTHDGIGMPADVNFPVEDVEEVLVHVDRSSASETSGYSISIVARSGDDLAHLERQADNVLRVLSRLGVDESHPAIDALRDGAERPRVPVADRLPDKDEADWLADRIRVAVERGLSE